MGGKRATRLRPATREPWRAEDLMPPVSCVCHLRPATACGVWPRHATHLSDLTPPPRHHTRHRHAHGFFIHTALGLRIFTRDRSQLQSLYMTFISRVAWYDSKISKRFSPYLRLYRSPYCTCIRHTPYPCRPLILSCCAFCGTSRYKRRADWASDAAERPVLSRSRRAGRGRRTAAEGRACRCGARVGGAEPLKM